MRKKREIALSQREDGYCISFNAMASPCEVIIETNQVTLAEQVGEAVTNEVWRIEDKYSRYDPQSICSQINNAQGKTVALDHETYLLLNFAQQCYELSEGLFDITSGILRQVWHFDGSDKIPSKKQVKNTLLNVGWHKVNYDEKSIILPKGMEIDLGGLGKEYAVDKAILLVKNITQQPTLVNLGGDLAATSARKNNQPWNVGIEHPGILDLEGNPGKNNVTVSLLQGALATSGDAKRYLLKAGKRYSHILNAKTGWPIENTPHSITVVAPQCIQAGILATLSLMQGKDAEDFLTEQEIKFWAIR